MKSKILLAVLILLSFSLPSFSVVTGIGPCNFNEKGEPISSPLTKEKFNKMINSPKADENWTKCGYVVAFWNRYTKTGVRITAEQAREIISRQGEIADFMMQNKYKETNRSAQQYFHYLSMINEKLWEIPGVRIKKDNGEKTNDDSNEEDSGVTIHKWVGNQLVKMKSGKNAKNTTVSANATIAENEADNGETVISAATSQEEQNRVRVLNKLMADFDDMLKERGGGAGGNGGYGSGDDEFWDLQSSHSIFYFR